MKKLKQTLIVWIAIYPTILLIQYFFGWWDVNAFAVLC